MSNLKIIKGDLFEADDNLCHGVNVKGAMGAGVAIMFKKNFPDMFEQYREICRNEKLKPGMLYAFKVDDKQYENRKYVFNLAIKNHWKEDAAYWAIEQSVKRMVFFMSKNNINSVSMPWIGCGLGGLKKDEVYKILETVTEKKNVKFTIYEL